MREHTNETCLTRHTSRFRGSNTPLPPQKVYYNGTFERYWWNQDSDAVNIYVPVPQGFDAGKVEFVAKTRHVSLKLDGEEVGLLFRFPLFASSAGVFVRWRPFCLRLACVFSLLRADGLCPVKYFYLERVLAFL